MKKVCIVILIVALVLSMIPLSAMAQESEMTALPAEELEGAIAQQPAQKEEQISAEAGMQSVEESPAPAAKETEDAPSQESASAEESMQPEEGAAALSIEGSEEGFDTEAMGWTPDIYYFRNDTSASSGVTVYYSKDGESLQTIAPGQRIGFLKNEIRSIMFFVKIADGYTYQSISFTAGQQEGTSTSINNAPSSLNNNSYTSAIQAAKNNGCAYEFHYSQFESQHTGENGVRAFRVITNKTPVTTTSIIYYSNDGTGRSTSQIVVCNTDETLLGEGTFTRNNYILTGWNTRANGKGTTYALGSTYSVGTRAVTLYAVWTATPAYRVTYDSFGYFTNPIDSNTYHAGDTVTVLNGDPAAHDQSQHIFIGWSTRAQDKMINTAAQLAALKASGRFYEGGSAYTMGSSNVAFYAVYAKQSIPGVNDKIVTFVAGTGGTLSGTTQFTDIPYETAWNSAVTVPTPVANDGYYFTGWTPVFPETVTESATYTANFAAKTTITLTANSGVKTYNGTAQTVTGYTGTPAGLIITGLTASGSGMNTGSYDVTFAGAPVIKNAAQQDITEQYSITYAAGTLTINKAALSITADNKSKTYGAINPELTYQVSGLQGADTLAGIGLTPSISTTAVQNSPVGDYPITVAGDAATTNYTVGYTPGTLTIAA
ncbi:MAG: MBG domain-containing protein, partial [Christensenella sp.]|nr:MBG domain-containing protein [Christensenella sp.]